MIVGGNLSDKKLCELTLANVSLFRKPSRRLGPSNNNEQHLMLVVSLLASSPA